MSSLVSTTVTSLAGSRDRWYAAVRPTWPAPRIRIFIGRCTPSPLHHFQISVLQHEPFGTLLLEIHLHACVRTLALDRKYIALAEFAVAYACAKPHAVTQSLHQRRSSQCAGTARRGHAGGRRARETDPRPQLFDQRCGDLLNKSRRRVVAVHAVQSTLLRIGP